MISNLHRMEVLSSIAQVRFSGPVNFKLRRKRLHRLYVPKKQKRSFARNRRKKRKGV